MGRTYGTWTQRQRRCRWAWGVLVAVVFLPAAARAQEEDPLETAGLQPTRAYVSVLPWERIDAYSGNLAVTVADLVLPGNAGFDLQVTRTYNFKPLGIRGWTFCPGKVLHAAEVSPYYYHPRIVPAEGGLGEPTFETGGLTGIFRTRDYWEYHRATGVAYVPNGATYTYGYEWATMNERYLTEMRDAFGNTITFAYEQPDTTKPPRVTSVVQDLGNAQTREVTFSYTSTEWTMTYLGRTWTYSWDASGHLVAVTPPVGSGWAYTYDGSGRLTDVTTPNGGHVHYHYAFVEIQSKHTYVVDQRTSSGRDVTEGTWDFSYAGEYTEVHHGSTLTVYTFGCIEYWLAPGTLFRREIKENGVLLESEALEWRVSAWLGNADSPSGQPYVGLLASTTTTRGPHVSSTAYRYSDDNLNDYGQAWEITEDGDFGRVTQRTFRHGFPDRFIKGKLESETVTGPGGSFTRAFTYDDDGFLHIVDTYGATTTFEPDARGNVASLTDADLHTTASTYSWGVLQDTTTPGYPITRQINPDGTVAAQTRGGATTTFVSDDLGRVIDVIPPVGAHTALDYTSFPGEKVLITRDGTTTTQTLDGFGRVVKTQDPVGVVIDTTYDADGRRTGETAPYQPPTYPELRWTSWAYDALDRVTTRTNPANPDTTVVTYAYDGLDVTITDENQHVTTQHWIATGAPGGARLASVTEPAGPGEASVTTSYTYDALGALTEVTHPNGRTRQWAYDATTHRLESETHPESGTVTYSEYWAAGGLKKMTDAAGKVFEYGYDSNDRLIQVKVDGVPTASFTYDAWDHRTGADSGAVQTTWAYQSGIRLMSRTDVVNGHPFVTTYESYDDRDNVTKIMYPSGREVSFAYDAANRVTRVYDPGTNLPYAAGMSGGEIAYHPSGVPTGYRAGNDTTYALTVNARGWPDHLISGPLDLTYHHDHAGYVVQLDDGRGAGWTQAFVYDAVNRLTDATGIYGSLGFSYDAVGNRFASGYTGYTYDPPTQRLMSRTAGGVTTDFAYDNNGSLIGQTVGGNATTFTYTPQRMVETVTANGATTTYQYDGEQQRTTQTGAGQTVYTIHEGAGRLLSTFVEQNGVLRWERDELYLGSQLLGAVQAWQPDPGVDYDQDRRSDVVVYRPTTGTWFMLSSASNYTTYTAYGFGGQAGDVPVPGDFDGDGIPDLGIYRPSTGTWYVLKSSTGFTQWDWFGWGGAGDVPAAGDFDQDGKTDAAVYRPATGEWFVKPSSGATPWSVTLGGASGDVPAVGDYDGDRRADIAVFRPSTATWLIRTSSSGYGSTVTYQFGATNDVPVPADFDGDRTTDLAVYRPSTGTWCVLTSSSGFTTWTYQGWGAAGDVPVPATDFDGDGRADYVVYRPSTGQWFVKPSGGGIAWSVQFGASGDLAVQPVVAPGVPAHPTVYVDYYHLDALGSVRVVTGELGTVLARHDFLPFGEEWTGAPLLERRLFTGHERDAETGLDYFGARYYRSDIGRFTTPDPGHVNGDVNDPLSWNAYAYARNNPLRFVDPEGLAYRVVVDGGAGPVWFLDDREFDWMVAHPELNPGITFDGGVISAGGMKVGMYEHFSDWDAVFGLAGDLAAYGLRREGKEMAAWAASGALGGALAAVLRGGLAASGTAVTTFLDVTGKGARYTNHVTNLTATEFQNNLLANGYKILRRGVSSNGPFTVLSRGEKTYTIYTATSTGALSADVKIAGQIIGKIRLSGF
jgi:RHS repeat-associated protein